MAKDNEVNLCAHCTECGQYSVDFIQMTCLCCGKKYPDLDRETMFDEDGTPNDFFIFLKKIR